MRPNNGVRVIVEFFSCYYTFLWLQQFENIKKGKKIIFTITGSIWVICPVSSNTITDVDIVWVTAPAIAAAPRIWNDTIAVKSDANTSISVTYLKIVNSSGLYFESLNKTLEASSTGMP